MDAATNSKVEIGCTMNVSQSHWDAIFKHKKTIGCPACGSNMTKVEQEEFLEDQWNCGYCGNTELLAEEVDEPE